MKNFPLQLGALFACFSSFVMAADFTVCNATQSCPEELPCCNQFGACGVGNYCLGGCHPQFSFKPEACMPMPVCKNISTDFTSKDQFMSLSDYLGNSDDTDWVYDGYVDDYDNDVLMAMPKDTTGTVISSTHFVWYGRIKSTFKTSRGGGIITAFILFSNVQDEIDWEFVGYNLTAAETNFYYQGVLNYTNVREVGTTDTFANFHTYEVDWQEDKIDWYLDDQLVRTLNKVDTWNETTKSYQFPQTPSRVQFSLWPGGSSQNAVGTVEWAGGAVDWNSQDIQEYGYYYVRLANVSITCYDPPAGTLIDGKTSYIFNSTKNFDQGYIVISNNNTVLDSNDDSGLDAKSSSDSSSGSSSSSSSSSSSGSSSKKTTTSKGSDATTGTDNKSKTTSTSSVYTGSEFLQFAQSSTQGTAPGSSNNGANIASCSLFSLLVSLTSYLLF